MKNLKKLAKELQVSPNAIVLAWMIQASPTVIPLVTGSSVTQLEENLVALSLVLNDKQLALLNQ